MTSITLIEKQLADLSKMDAKVLDIVAEDGDTTLLHGAFPKDIALPELPGGWKASLSWENSREESIKKVILLPATHRTRAIWKIGQMKVGMRAGLTETQCTAWINSHAKQKHELLGRLVEVLRNPNYLKAYQNPPSPELTPRIDYKTREPMKGPDGKPVMDNRVTHEVWIGWLKKNNIRISMHDSKHANLAQLVADVAGGSVLSAPNPVLSNALLAAQARVAAAEAAKKEVAAEDDCLESSLSDEELDTVVGGNSGAHPSADSDILDVDTADMDDRLAAAVAEAGLTVTADEEETQS